MKCENCQELLSEFIDDQLDAKLAARVQAHLTLCKPCAELYEDFFSILGVCDLDAAEDVPPPNEQALWCRINNIIESEVKPPAEVEKKAAEKQSWLARIWNGKLSLSSVQLASVVLSIALISSLLTVVGLRNALPNDDPAAKAANSPTLFERALSQIGLAETPQQTRERRLREQRAAIDYWNKRAIARRAQWDKPLRDAFDRNLHEIDQVVTGYTRTLEENPQDDLSGEMLDSALNEKMELLREFSEL